MTSRNGPVTTLRTGVAKTARVLRTEGTTAVLQRVARILYARTGASALAEPLLAPDIADSAELSLALPATRPAPGTPLTVGWVTLPPSAGSGGHTTLFRMIEAVERAGHRCVIFLYDRYGGDMAAHEAVIRQWWPRLQAGVRDASQGIDGVDAAVASSWDSAHVLARRGESPMRRLYFIQDYEPFFYPHGSMYALAEDTYRFGFRNIALGEMVAQALRDEAGVEPDVTEFGCDTRVYRPLGQSERTGIVAYARPDVPRRGFWLARLALEQFHRMHPDVDIHLFGDTVPSLPFPATQHGRISPAEINDLYNRCIAGVAMSFTNVSLVAEEMLAAGVIPVINDSPGARADLGNEHVAWARPTPAAIAAALSAAITRPDRFGAVEDAAGSVRQSGWSRAQADVVRIVEEEVYGS